MDISTGSTNASRIEQKFEIESTSTNITSSTNALNYFDTNNYINNVIERNPDELMRTNSTLYSYSFIKCKFIFE